MAGTDDRDADRLPGRARRQHDRTAAPHDDGAQPEAVDDDIDAVTRLMGFLRSDER